MALKHAVTKTPGQRVFAVSDWNASHIIDGNTGEILFRGAAGAITTESNLFWDAVNKRLGIGTADPQAEIHNVGTTRLGDQATNYASFDGEGFMTRHGDARSLNAIWVDAGGLRAPGLKPATFVEHGLNGAWQFANAVAGSEESISGNMRMPQRMDRSVAPTLCVGWSSDGISPGVCRWQLEYLWRSPNENTILGAQETLTIDSTASATTNGLIVAEITGIDLPSDLDACLHYKIKRLSAHPNDTIAGTTELLGVVFNFTSNRLGGAI